MTYDATDDNGRVEDYVKLEDGVYDGAAFSSSSGCCGDGGGGWWWSWVKLVLLVAFVGVLAAVFFKWVEPFLMDKEIIPIINWERETWMLALQVFGSVAIFPTFLLPSTPSMWVAGMTFGYGHGFLLIIGAVAFGVSIPYFIGSLFHHKIQAWLDRHSKKALIIRLAGEGTWFNQFQAVVLIRISPFPYVIYNYGSVASDVKYGPYLLGTPVGMTPEIFVAIYSGILMKTLADASHNQHGLSALQIVFNVIGFCITVATTLMVTLYAKRRLKELQTEELPLW